jgi:hypothetical protein
LWQTSLPEQRRRAADLGELGRKTVGKQGSETLLGGPQQALLTANIEERFCRACKGRFW